MKTAHSKKEKVVDLLCEPSIKEKNLSLLYEKYPEIAFQYSCASFSAGPIPEEDLYQWKECLPLEGIDTLYVYGLGRGIYYGVLAKWLKEKKERALIFLETSLEEIDALLAEDNAEAVLIDPQVSLRYVSSPKLWDAVLHECALAFPSDRVEFVASSRYKKKYPKKISSLRMTLLRNAALVHSLLSEALHYHVLTQNLASNFSHMIGASYANLLKGSCKNIPAIICGAGPSLSTVTEELKQLSSHAIIFAGGSAITALAAQGVRAHIAMALDPNYEEYTRLKPSQAFGTPFFFASRIHPGVFDLISSPLAYMSTDTGGTLEAWLEEKLSLQEPPIGKELSAEALSVTTIAVSLAELMGCSPIIFCGVDLAYTGMKRYSDGVMTSSSVSVEALKKETKALEKMVLRKDRHGKKIHTLVKWVMEARCLSQFAKDHPMTQFYKGTDAGLEIPGVAYSDFREIARELKKNSYDLHGLLHAKMQETLIVPSLSLAELKLELLESLQRACHFIKEILREVEELQQHIEESHYPLISARRSVFEMDLQDEMCYPVLLSLAPQALERLLQRRFWTEASEESLEYRRTVAEKELYKWKQMHQIVKYCQKTISFS